jgi:hypothetical protein
VRTRGLRGGILAPGLLENGRRAGFTHPATWPPGSRRADAGRRGRIGIACPMEPVLFSARGTRALGGKALGPDARGADKNAGRRGRAVRTRWRGWAPASTGWLAIRGSGPAREAFIDASSGVGDRRAPSFGTRPPRADEIVAVCRLCSRLAYPSDKRLVLLSACPVKRQSSTGGSVSRRSRYGVCVSACASW